MSDYGDIVKRVMNYAGKTGTADTKIVENTLDGVLDDINAEFDSYVVATRDNTVAVTAGDQTVTMPDTCKRIIELGRYDSALDMIRPPYIEVTEFEFNRRFRGITTISSISPTNINVWFPIDETAAGVREIRLVYPPDESFTMSVRFFEALSKTNMDRMELQELLYHGCVKNLGKWFKEDQALAYNTYNKEMTTLKGAVRTMNRAIPARVSPQIAQHNALGASLVN